MKRKILSLLLITTLLLGIFVGCGKTEEPAAPADSSPAPTTSPEDSKEEPAEDTKELVEISMFYPMHPSHTLDRFDLEGDKVLEEITGVKINWELAPATNVEERFNITMASADIPDVIIGSVSATTSTSLRKYVDAFEPLNERIVGNERYANLEKYIFEDEYVSRYLSEDDGNIYIVPMLSQRKVGDIFMMRGDLLDKHELEEPVTWEDWKDTLLTIKELEPDIVPYSTRHKRAGLMRISEAWGVREDFFYEDGEIKYGVLDPRLKEVVDYLRDLYANGLIDREYLTTDTAAWQEQILTRGVFAMNDNITRISWARTQLDEAGKPDWNYRGVLPMEGPEGIRMTTIQYPRVRGNSASISHQSPHIDRILDMYDYIFSDEGEMLVNWGIEGVSYHMVNGEPQPDEEYKRQTDADEIPGIGITRDSPKNQIDIDLDYYSTPEMLEIKDKYEDGIIQTNYLTPLIFTDEETRTMTPILAEMNTFKDEWLDKFITGIEPMDKYDQFVEDFEALGVATVVDIYNDALDRFMAG